MIGNSPVAAVNVIAKFSVRRQELRIPSVVAYDAPDVKTNMRETFIEKVDLGEFEITQSSNDVFVTMDLSAIEIPPNCMLGTANFEFTRVVTMRGFQFVGIPKIQIRLDKLNFKIASS